MVRHREVVARELEPGAPGRAGELLAVLAQLEGFEAPAGAWETEILPTRINEYDPAWLDE